MSSVASRTKYELLAVEDAEQSEEEEELQEPGPEPSPVPAQEEPVKLTKTAQKKAAKAARLEKQQRKRTSASASPAGGASPAPVVPPALPPTPPPEAAFSYVDVSKDYPSTPAAQPSTTAEHPAGKPPRHEPAPAEKETLSVPEAVSQDLEQPNPTIDDADASAFTSIVSSGRSSPQFDVPTPAEGAEKRQNGHAVSISTSVPDSETTKKRQAVLTRTLWTLIMIGGFLTFLMMGHAYMIILVMLCQTLVYREVTRLFTLTGTKKEDAENGRDPWSKTLNWYFFAVVNYFLYGESIIYYFKHVVFADANLTLFATNHRMISFTLYTIGFMGFVMSLKKGYLKQQFGLFCWVHMSLLLVVVSSHFIVNNILEGLIWFWVPASLVICNDIFAYIWGITLGRTPLIALSPKKTVEGFVGAFISTIVFAIIWGTYFSQMKYMICPVHDLGVNAFSDITCTPNPIFDWRECAIWPPVAHFLSTLLRRQITTIPYMPYQIHLFFMACFASLVAPFGGFFASGFKRAFNIKDFGHSIPGHGGMTDRMDCQFLMGVFTYVYYSSLIREHNVSVGSVLQSIVSGLTIDEQVELFYDLKRYLEQQHVALRS